MTERASPADQRACCQKTCCQKTCWRAPWRLSWLLGICLVLLPLPVLAQPDLLPAPPPPDAQPDARGADGDAPPSDPRKAIDEAVALALFERSKLLFERGDYANAKTLLGESLERSVRGPVSRDALLYLQRCNAELGIPDPNHGAPPELKDAPSAVEVPLDPYGGAGETDILDPYGTETLDPYELPPDSDAGEEVPEPAVYDADGWSEADVNAARRTLMGYGALYGFTTGFAVAESGDESDHLAAGFVGAGAGLAGAYLLTRGEILSAGEMAGVAWGGLWGGTSVALMADLATGIDSSDPADILWSASLGGLLGSGAGWLASRKLDPSPGDVALVGSLSVYGMMSGLLVGVGMDPPESEAYSLNMLMGTAIGVAAGLYAANRLEVSRRRMLWVDIGATVGALAPWVIVYPLIADGESDTAVQATGWISTLGLLGGAYLAWRGTSDMDDRALRVDRKQIAGVPALLQRGEDGAWGVGMLSLRPAGYTQLAPATARGWSIDLVGGRF